MGASAEAAGPMRILGLVDVRCVHIPKWANYFAKRGHRIHLVSFSPLTPTLVQAFDPAITFETWTIPTLHLKRPWLTARTIWRLRQTVRRARPDFVNVHFLGHAAWYAALSGLRPLVVTVMGGDLVGCEFRPATRRERYLTPFTLRRSDLAVCWSRNLLRIVSPMLRTGAVGDVVVGGVDLDVFGPGGAPALRESLGLEPDDFVILSPRIFRPLYNIDIVVKAFASVLRRLPRARLLLVKHHAVLSPEYTQQIEGLLDELAVRQSTRLISEIPNAEMPRYYRAADCTVSIPDTDGTPMTVLESMACGTPVIVQDLPEYDPSLFVDEETVLKVPPRDSEALGRAMFRLAFEPAVRDTLRRRGPAVATAHASYHSEMARLERLYRDVLERGRSPRSP